MSSALATPYLVVRTVGPTGTADVGEWSSPGARSRTCSPGRGPGTRSVVGVMTGAHSAAELGRVRHPHLVPGVASQRALLAQQG